jgi:hypothetical protein
MFKESFMKNWSFSTFILMISIGLLFPAYAEDGLQEFQIKRKEVYEFTKEPTVKKDGDKISIEFTSKDFCDVTVVIQNKEGDIVRHLASGVLGDNAPVPFQQKSLSQKLIWDSKDDRGKYLDNIKDLDIRVSLGLKPTYEKNLYTTPYKRISAMPAIATTKEGVYVYEGFARDELRLFGHDGEYIKTIYPFPASKIESVKGLKWAQFANRNKLPVKNSNYHQTLLTSGDNDDELVGPKAGMGGKAAASISIQNDRIAIVNEHLNRLSTDGSTGNFNLKGPAIGYVVSGGGYGSVGNGKKVIGPSSTAFSPDGKTVYCTGMMWGQKYGLSGSIQAVLSFNYDSDEPAKEFVGKNNYTDFGSGNDQFCAPSSVDTDAKGNVYVSDFINNRIQIFDANAKFLATINVNRPAKVLVHKITGIIYVFSYGLIGVPNDVVKKENYDMNKVERKLSVFSAFPDSKPIPMEGFPIDPLADISRFCEGNSFQIALDSWSKNVAFWLVRRKFVQLAVDDAAGGRRDKDFSNTEVQNGIKRIEYVDSKWVEKDNFGRRVNKELVRPNAPYHNIQNLYVNPKNKKLYVGEADSGPTTKAFSQLIEINPETGVSKVVVLPYNPMDIAIDIDGLAYLRTMNVIGRYDMDTWKEVPFDYGSEKDKVGQDGGMGGKSSPVVSSILLPATNAVCYHQGGLDVNVRGDILVACHNGPVNQANDHGDGQPIAAMAIYKEYTPPAYPGRLLSSTSICLHIWSKNGQIKSEDILPGCPQTDGVFLDENDNVYIMATPFRKINDKKLDDGSSSSLFKFKSKKGRFLTSESSPLPLEKSNIPQRTQEIAGLWAENFDWTYGGVGFGGFNVAGCACWFARFKLDYFARSFAPEPMQYGVSVLDANGNLITRIGKYGNADSCGPNSKEPLGGDEVGLIHPCFVGVHTDKRLFISDVGNDRIVSVKLDYYVNKILPIIP